MKKIHVILFFLFSLSLSAQTEPVDSAFLDQMDSVIAVYEQQEREQKVREAIDDYNDKLLQREMDFHTEGTMNLVRGLMLTWTDRRFMFHTSNFPKKGNKSNWPDYGVASMPLIATWAMRASGVKSRSKLQRMVTANALSLIFSSGGAYLLKSGIDEARPDHSDHRSFPSGHTTFAFASATILAREYGYLSPWISVGGYATATATQFLRVKHNKHFMNDLYVGAGVGMLGTSLGYFITDQIFGEKGINAPELRQRDMVRILKFNDRPSGLAFVSGTEIGNRSIHIDEGVDIKMAAAISSGADISWYLTPNVAAEFMTRVVDAQCKVYDGNSTYTGGHLDLYHFDVAAKYSIPYQLTKRFSGRALAGVRVMDGDDFVHMKNERTYTIPNETKFELGLGLGYECLDKENYAVGFNCDYYHTFSSYMNNRFSISTIWKILF